MADQRTFQTLQFKQLLCADSPLGNWHQHGKLLMQLEEKLHHCLGSPLNKHTKIANYSSDTLILHADSAAWASKLRYDTAHILHYFQQECQQLCTIKTIRVKVRPKTAEQ